MNRPDELLFAKRFSLYDLIIYSLREHEHELEKLTIKLDAVSRSLEDLTGGVGIQKIKNLYSQRDSILIVDDDEYLLSTFKMVLETVGCNVDTALSGQEALKKYIPNKYKLIILDIILPDIMGDKVADHILEQDDAQNIIMITGYVPFLEKAKNMEIRGKKILVKPIEPKYLLEITQKSLF